MLERVGASPQATGDKNVPLLDVSRIHPDSTFECFAYVRGGQHKFTKAGKPFITLYLQDVNGVVIPGYLFNPEDFKHAGLELTKVIHSIVCLTVTENYLPRMGMSVILDAVAIVTSPTLEMTTAFVGKVDNIQTVYNSLLESIASKLGIKVTLPYNICTTSYMEYYQGKVGGQCLHYLNTLKILEVWAQDMSPEEQHQLFVAFVLYVFVHSNYRAAAENGDDDIRLVTTLSASVSKYMERLQAGDGASEVIHLFFGYKPKDIFVRAVHQAAQMNLRMMDELSAYRALPLSREGDAGYGTIKRYPEKG